VLYISMFILFVRAMRGLRPAVCGHVTRAQGITVTLERSDRGVNSTATVWNGPEPACA